MTTPSPPTAEALEEQIARTIAESYGSDPDDHAPLSVMCTSDNRSVPWWRVYEEQARALLAPDGPLAPLLAELEELSHAFTGWIERAQAAEARAARLEKALEAMLHEWDKITRYESPLAKAGNENVSQRTSAMPSDSLHAAVDLLRKQLQYHDECNIERAEDGEHPCDELDVNAESLRLILCALSEMETSAALMARAINQIHAILNASHP